MKLKVSVIIPTYNRGHLIAQTLDSVVQQTYQSWECIVVDDGSTDDTETVVQSYAAKDDRFKFYHRPHQHQPGGNGARNFGVTQSNGDLLVFLDSDDLLAEASLKDRVTQFKQASADILISHTGTFKLNIGDSERIWNMVEPSSSITTLIKRFISMDMPWHTTGVTWSSTFFKSTSGWNEQLKAWQDWELHCRVLFSDPSITYMPAKPDNYFRIAQHDSIGKSIRTVAYMNSIVLALQSINGYLVADHATYEVLKLRYHALLYKMLIHFPVIKGFTFFPLRILFKLSNFKGLSFFTFLKYYSLEMLAKISILKKNLIRKSLERYRKRIHLENYYLKYKVSDLKN